MFRYSRILFNKVNKHITFVKKINEDGSVCKKCSDVFKKMEKNDILKHINSIETIDMTSNNPNQIGLVYSKKYNINYAPFFIARDGNNTKIYKFYTEFLNKELNIKTNKKQQIEDMFDKNYSNDLL